MKGHSIETGKVQIGSSTEMFLAAFKSKIHFSVIESKDESVI